jgi:hypothetical protein
VFVARSEDLGFVRLWIREVEVAIAVVAALIITGLAPFSVFLVVLCVHAETRVDRTSGL